VLVSTKFDTKLPQFGRALDVEMFIHPAAALGIGEQAEGPLGGAPFFTWVLPLLLLLLPLPLLLLPLLLRIPLLGWGFLQRPCWRAEPAALFFANRST